MLILICMPSAPNERIRFALLDEGESTKVSNEARYRIAATAILYRVFISLHLELICKTAQIVRVL